MEGMLKVTPEKLLQTSGEFSTLGNQMKSLTGEMLSLVKSLNGVWHGEAASAYGNKFDSLAPDMEKLYRMVQEHVQDLQEMARQYQSAESGNMEQGNSLNSNIIS
ncbi:MAG: WXG100 family type VII secretion target [Suilimivivens sp.]